MKKPKGSLTATTAFGGYHYKTQIKKS